MHRRIADPRPRGTAALVLIGLAVAACSDLTGPGGGRGRQLVETPGFTDWTWLPSSQEILYSTPFDYPYTGPPTHLEAVAISSGARRTVVAPFPNGDRISAYGLFVRGSHVYFTVWPLKSDVPSFFRAPLDGSSAPEKLLDGVASLNPSVSPDERALAWFESDQTGTGTNLVTMDVATGTRRAYPVQQPVGRIVWSPTGRSVVLDVYNGGPSETGTPFQWIDLETGTVRVWVAPSYQITLESTRDFQWVGDTPFLYTSGQFSLARYSLSDGSREGLATISPQALAVGWTPDFETAVIATNECVRVSSGPFSGNCLRWATSLERVTWRTGAHRTILRRESPTQIGGRLSPDGESLAYRYASCPGGCYSTGDGLYVVPVR